jgi:hypothetical protein
MVVHEEDRGWKIPKGGCCEEEREGEREREREREKSTKERKKERWM